MLDSRKDIYSYCDEYEDWTNATTTPQTYPQDPTTEIRRVAYQIVAPITVAIGILGNILNLLILLTKPFLKGGTKVYMTALAISDLFVMLSVIPMVIRWNRSQTKSFEVSYYHAHVELFVNNTFIASSVFIVVCLTIERYFSVCLPTMFRSVHTVKVARNAVFSCYLTAVLVSLPLTALKSICIFRKNREGTHEWDFHENTPITNTIYWSIYLWISEFFVRFGPCFVLGTLNILIIQKFRKITAKRKMFRKALSSNCSQKLYDNFCEARFMKTSYNRKYQEEKRLINLLKSIVILFFITMTPSAILSLVYTERSPAIGFQVFRAVANNLELANFGLNFYVYFFCSKEFRAAFTQLFSGCMVREEKSSDLETGDVESNKMSVFLKVIKMSDMSDFNSSAGRCSIEYSGTTVTNGK